MITLITEIIEKFGPRPAGTDAEKNAQLFIADKCRQFTQAVRVLPFDEYLDARFGKLKYYVVLYLAALVLYWVQPEMALAISLVNAFFIVFDLMSYRDVLTSFPGKLQTSHNVEAVLEPQGEVKSTLIISGHMDSTREYTWWYKLGGLGIKLTILAGVLIVIQLLFYIWHEFAPASFHNYVWVGLLLLSPVLIVYWSMHAEHAVEGAQDNLSGIAIAYTTFKTLAAGNPAGRSGLQHTRVKFVSFGSEEKGLCGSRAYVKQNLAQLKNENVHLINVDGVRLVDEIAIVYKELMNGTSHSPALISGLKKAFTHQGISFKNVMIPIGGTDAVSFARAGLPSVTLIGMSASQYDFTYHTRHDKVEHIEPLALEHVKNGIVEFAKKWDENNGK